jgi:hypothetical protein
VKGAAVAEAKQGTSDSIREVVAAQIRDLRVVINAGEHEGWILDYAERILAHYLNIQRSLDEIQSITDETF